MVFAERSHLSVTACERGRLAHQHGSGMMRYHHPSLKQEAMLLCSDREKWVTVHDDSVANPWSRLFVHLNLGVLASVTHHYASQCASFMQFTSKSLAAQ